VVGAKGGKYGDGGSDNSDNSDFSPRKKPPPQQTEEDVSDQDPHGQKHDEEEESILQAIWSNFLGHSSKFFKIAILSSLALNPIILLIAGETIATWGVLTQFLFTLAMALEAYPLQAGGLLVIEANLLGLTNPHTLLHEVTSNLNVIIMVIFMVAAIHFLKNLLLWVFTKILLKVKNKTELSVFFVLAATILSAFLDALTVSAVVVSVCTGFLAIYYYVVKECSLPRLSHWHNNRGRGEMDFTLMPKVDAVEKKRSRNLTEEEVDEVMTRVMSKDSGYHQQALETIIENGVPIAGQAKPESSLTNPDGSTFDMPSLKTVMERKISEPKGPAGVPAAGEMAKIDENIKGFQAFLRSLLMHCAVGTTFGGIMTMVGEPQNLIIAERMQWTFAEFIIQMMPVWACVLPCGVAVCVLLEQSGQFGYGAKMPEDVRTVLESFEEKEYGKMHGRVKAMLAFQVLGAVLLCLGLVLHFAEVGFIGLMVVILLTSFNGITEEHEIAHAFLESMPFVSLLVVFFGIVGMIHDQHLFKPIIDWVLNLDESLQASVLFLVNGLLSMVSDNVFVATIFVDEVTFAYHESDGQHRDGASVDHSGQGHGKEHAAHRRLQHGGHGHEAAGHAAAHSEHMDTEDHVVAAISSTTGVPEVGVKMTKKMFEKLGIAIVSGTNLPSMATPNGQASLLFILTSNIAPLVHLSYGQMCLMTLPYTCMATVVGLLAVVYLV
jgi:Na+/H+ antiporter NhaB